MPDEIAYRDLDQLRSVERDYQTGDTTYVDLRDDLSPRCIVVITS